MVPRRNGPRLRTTTPPASTISRGRSSPGIGVLGIGGSNAGPPVPFGGGPAHVPRVHERLAAIMRQAELAETRKPVHSFRHQLASELIVTGAPITAPRQLLGHANPAVLLGRYARASLAGLQGA